MIRKILSIALLTLPLTLFGQTSGKISGKVSDKEGNALSGANIVVEGTSLGAASDNNGAFVILGVPVGTYTVRCDYIGFSALKISNVSVSSGLTTLQDFGLEKSAIEGAVVEVTAEKKLVEQSATNSVRSVTAEDIENTASRSVTGLLDLQPGVVVLNGELHIRGSRAEEVGYTLDGADIKDPISSGRMVSAIPEALSELKIEAGGYGADVGGANSGVVRQTLRTGSSEFSGSVRAEKGDFGHQDLTATLSGPAGPVKYFVAVSKKHEDDWNPTFYDGFTIDLDKDGVADMLPSYESGVTPDGDTIQVTFDPDAGIKNRWSDDFELNSTALLDLGAFNLRLSALIDNSTYSSNSTPLYYLFNSDRLPERNINRMVIGARANFFLSPNFLISGGISSLNREYESYDGLFGKPGSFADAVLWGDSTSVASKTDSSTASNWRSAYQAPVDYYVGQFAFQRPGDITTGWAKSDRESFTFDVNTRYQLGGHEFKAGVEIKQFEYRNYYLSTSAISNINRIIATDTTITRESAVGGSNQTITNAMSLYNRSNPGNIGFDDYGNEVDGDYDGPRKPSTTSFYINDKYEADDLVINGGIRIDQFNLDDWKMNNSANPGWNETGQTIHESEFKKSETKTVVQPRLGMAFPVSDKTVFHLQYGKYAQMPELDLPYASSRYMHLVWGGQNYTPDPMGFDLDPIETTQYEIGLSYQFSTDAAIDATAFAKNTTGQIVIGKNRDADATVDGYYGADVDALYYQNGDFSTINGFEFTFRTRRVNRLQTFATYTWSDARGVNSDPNSSAGNLVQEALAAPAAMIMPLYYENKHRGSIVLDYRFGDDDGGILFSNVGFNLQYKFNSGHPFTLSDGGMGQRASDTGALLDDARAREPQEPIGQSVTPWNHLFNLKVDKKLAIGGQSISLFGYIENVFNTKNVINVYSRTGNAYNDGFLTDPALSSEIVAAQGDLYEELYKNVNLSNRQHYTWDFGQDLFGTPRTYKFGASINF
ncbi:MAG: TonB-dependent receptor [Candidatus Marinimicrobia bacterium]|jgi:hypothetical protein|nr:TonB-dependent receptor [Candidatus Neomarinimicrobiota bacterium]